MNSDISWGQQVAVMFQIVSTMALELPSFLGELEELRGMSPNIQLQCEPWGHNNHEDIDCECQASDRTATYVHDLTVNRRGYVHSPDAGVASTSCTGADGHLCIEPGWEKGCPGLVSFVSCGPGAYGRLLYMCGGGQAYWCLPIGYDQQRGAAGGPVFRTAGVVRLTRLWAI